MANEAVCIETPTLFRRVTVADGTGLAIGTLMKWSADPNTCAASSADNDKFAGILWEEKTANDGITEVTLARNGKWDIKDSGAGLTMGAMANLGGANLVKTAASGDTDAGTLVGRVLETASNDEVVAIEVFAF